MPCWEKYQYSHGFTNGHFSKETVPILKNKNDFELTIGLPEGAVIMETSEIVSNFAPIIITF